MLFNPLGGRGPAWVTGIRRLLGGARVEELASELHADFTIENDRPEWAYLKGEKLCWGRVNVGASVANRSLAILRNPAGSGVLMVLQSFLIQVTAGVPCIFQPNSVAAAATDVGGQLRDHRGTVLGALVLNRWFSKNTAVLPSGAFVLVSTGAAQITGSIDVVLSPGTEIYFTANADNIAVEASCVWRERQLSELES